MTPIYLCMLFFCMVHAKNSVPVLIWNSNQVSTDIPAVSALQQINYPTFQAKYLNAFSPDNVLLFLMDALSVEDLSSHPEELHHIAHWMNKSHSLYLPNVENAAHLAHDLPHRDYNVVTLGPGSSVAGISLKKDSKNLVVVKLPSTITNPSRRRAILKTDEVIQSVVSKIGYLADFTVVLTGMEPSMEIDEAVEHLRVSRSLQQKFGDLPEDMKGFHSEKCILLYLREDISFNIYNGTTASSVIQGTIPDTPDSVTADCGERQSIHLNYIQVQIGDYEYSKLNVQFFYKNDSGSWTIDGAALSLMKGKEVPTNILLKNKQKQDWVPFGMSFACSKKITFIQDSVVAGDQRYEIQLNGVQIQAYTEDNKEKFGSSWDCVGFFTVPIWCGLLTALLCTTILAWGLYMLAEVRTMDRFDDPKGKTIMIPTTLD